MEKWEEVRDEEQLRCGYSESCYSAIRRRLNLQSIGAYLRDGSNKVIISNDSFQDREATAFSKLERLLTEKYGEEETNTLIPAVIAYVCVVQEIYFNLGLKSGTILHSKLTDNFETDI